MPDEGERVCGGMRNSVGEPGPLFAAANWTRGISEDFLRKFVLNAYVRVQNVQARIPRHQLIHPAKLKRTQPGTLRELVADCRVADPVLPARHRNGKSGGGLVENRCDPQLAEGMCLHRNLLFPPFACLAFFESGIQAGHGRVDSMSPGSGADSIRRRFARKSSGFAFMQRVLPEVLANAANGRDAARTFAWFRFIAAQAFSRENLPVRRSGQAGREGASNIMYKNIYIKI